MHRPLLIPRLHAPLQRNITTVSAAEIGFYLRHLLGVVHPRRAESGDVLGDLRGRQRPVVEHGTIARVTA